MNGCSVMSELCRTRISRRQKRHIHVTTARVVVCHHHAILDFSKLRPAISILDPIPFISAIGWATRCLGGVSRDIQRLELACPCIRSPSGVVADPSACDRSSRISSAMRSTSRARGESSSLPLRHGADAKGGLTPACLGARHGDRPLRREKSCRRCSRRSKADTSTTPCGARDLAGDLSTTRANHGE